MAPITAAASALLKPSYRVAIVGAGVAGLTAARELLSSKRLRADELVVLEASDRIGGRVRSVSFGSSKPVKIEVGAAWIHGASPDNRFFRDVIVPAKIDFKVISERNPWLYPASCTGFELYDGNDKLDEESVQYAWKLSEELLKTLQRYATTEELVDQYGDRSVQQIVEVLVASDSETNAHNAELKRLVAGHERGKELVAFCLVLIECWMGATSDSLQLEDFEVIDLIGDDPGAHCLVAYGMEQTVTHLALSIDAGVIHTNMPVELIEYSPTEGVTLHAGGDGDVVRADHVIVTCSLGALKSEKIQFSPPLPDAKRGAIRRSSMGQYMKVLVEFPEVFWPESTQFFGQTAAPGNGSIEGLSFPLVFNYFSVKGAPLLEAVLFGKAALDASELEDSEIVDAYLHHLHRLFGREIPAPVSHFITRWNKDPWAVGAYSYLTLDSSSGDPELLRETVSGRVLFAGEATNMQYQGSLQAAYLSGLTAVEELATISSCPKREH